MCLHRCVCMDVCMVYFVKYQTKIWEYPKKLNEDFEKEWEEGEGIYWITIMPRILTYNHNKWIINWNVLTNIHTHTHTHLSIDKHAKASKHSQIDTRWWWCERQFLMLLPFTLFLLLLFVFIYLFYKWHWTRQSVNSLQT